MLVDVNVLQQDSLFIFGFDVCVIVLVKCIVDVLFDMGVNFNIFMCLFIFIEYIVVLDKGFLGKMYLYVYEYQLDSFG